MAAVLLVGAHSPLYITNRADVHVSDCLFCSQVDIPHRLDGLLVMMHVRGNLLSTVPAQVS